MQKLFTSLLAFLLALSAFAQKTPLSGLNSKDPMEVDNTDVQVLTLPDGLRPTGAKLIKPNLAAARAIALGNSMSYKEENIDVPNNTPGTATPLGSTSVRLRGNLFPNGDVDYYSFAANAGDRVYAATMTAFSSGSSTDSQLTLVASDGTTVIEFDDDNGSFAALSSSIAGAIIPATGTYYLKVNDFTAGTTSERPYDLYLKVQSGSPAPEVEPNDTPATATNAPANGWVSGSRNPATATEQDWYAINLQAGETVFLSLDLDPERDGISWNGRLGIGLFGDADNQIIVVDDAGAAETPNPTIPSEALFFTVKESGTYYLFVDSANAATGGPTATYNLSVSKLDALSGYTTYTSTDVPKTIGPAAGSTSSTLTIPGTKLIKDLAVRITLNHALMQDIDAILTTPEGNQIELFSDIGAAATGGQTQMDLRLDDYNGIPPSFTVLKNVALLPELNSKLDQLRGMNTNGNWTLTLYDDTNNSAGGTLTSWSLDVLEDTTPTTLATQTKVYSQDFETSDGGFTHSGTNDQWALGTPNTPPTTTANPVAAFTTAHSGQRAWKTNLTGPYAINSNQLLESPDIDLTGVTGNTITLSWAMKYQMESASFDHLQVYLEAVDGSVPRQTLFTWLGATQTSAVGNPVVNIGRASGWGTYFANISAFTGKKIRLKIQLDSDNTVVLGGVAIDDVNVYVDCTAATAPVLAGTNQTTICTGSVASLSASCSIGTVNWYDAAGSSLLATGSPFTTPALTANATYKVQCANGACLSDFVAVNVTVTPASVGGTVTGTTTVCAGTNSVTLSLTGNTGAVQQWQSSTSAAFSSPIDIVNSTPSLTVTNLTQTTYYRAVVRSGVCSPTNSSTVVITVSPAVTATIGGALTVCAGQSTVLTASGGTAYVWNTGATSATIVATAGPYSVTVSRGACSATISTTVTAIALPMPALIGLASAYCQNAGSQSLSGSPSGGTFTVDGNSATSFNPASLSVGQHTVVYSSTNSNGCSNTATQPVTVKAVPAPPIIVTATGYPYPAGVSSLTLSQNVGPVSLTASGCSGGMLMANGNAASSFTISTAMTGTQTYTATCTQNGCTGPAASFQLTVVPPTLSVLHRDADYGQLTNNILKPYLELANAGGQAIPYSELTVRYWFTSEGNAPPTNLAVYYAQLGTVNMQYVPLSPPRQGAYGYVEYSFPGGSSLSGGGNSGPIENGIQKTDGSNFDESDDYSYQATYQDYVPNAHVTAYRNGVIVWGQEPTAVASQTAVQVYSQAIDQVSTSQIQTRVELRNTGNVALPVAGLKLRYYFTSDNGQVANVNVDYADIGAANVQASVVKLASPVSGADSYVELTFPGNTGQLNALSSLGAIDFRLVRSDYGLLDQSNDYSYAANYGNEGLNNHITAYLNNNLIFGTPPAGAPARVITQEATSALKVRLLGNPVIGSQAEVEITGVSGQAVCLKLIDLQGRTIHEQRIEQAGQTERVSLPLSTHRGQLLLKVNTNTQQLSLKLLRP